MNWHRYVRRSLLLVVVLVSGAVGTSEQGVVRRGPGAGSRATATHPRPAAAMAPSGPAVPSTLVGVADPPPSPDESGRPAADVEQPQAVDGAPAGDVAHAPPSGDEELSEAAAAPPVELRASQFVGTSPSGGTWAVLIGIDDYPGGGYDLGSAVKDVDDVDEALSRFGVTNDRRMVLRNGQASADGMLVAMDWLTANAGPDATMVVFYAGHIQKLAAGSEALVGADGGLVHDTELAAMLDRSPASRAWIGIAGCYAGGFTEVLKPGRVLTAAAAADQVAYENASLGRSYLVEYLVHRAMLANGITTVEEAFAWASAELRREHPDRQPVMFDHLAGDLDLRVAIAPAGPAPAGPAPAAPPPPPAPAPPAPDGCAAITIGIVRCSR